MITVGELFAGIGGLGLGLEMTGRFEAIARWNAAPRPQEILNDNFKRS